MVEILPQGTQLQKAFQPLPAQLSLVDISRVLASPVLPSLRLRGKCININDPENCKFDKRCVTSGVCQNPDSGLMPIPLTAIARRIPK